MRAAIMKERPDFPLMRQTDVQHIYHMQMPRWLFSDSRYADMNLDTKVAYTFLLNRFQLSRRNGWVNDRGEVFVIFPRKELARELRICEQRVTAAFRQLAARKLIWEKRCGRGDANQIYLASVEPTDDPAYTCAPFKDAAGVSRSSRVAKSEVFECSEGNRPLQEPQDPLFLNNGSGSSRTAETAVAEPQSQRPSYIDPSEIDPSHMEISLSAVPDRADEPSEEEMLTDILDACELYTFEPEIARIFENAIERLFYSDSFRVGNVTLPKSRVRSKLRRLDGMVLRAAESKLHANLTQDVKNSTAYTMAVIFNCITECEGDLLVDPYLNSLRDLSKGGG